MTAAGGAGNDALVGGDSSETLLGGSGNDAISGGGGIDFVSGDDGDDQINVRDGNADLARGGDGWDLVIADDGLDILDGFETVHAPPVMAPPPDPTPPPAVTPPPVVTPPPGVTSPPVVTPPSTDTSIRPVTISGGTLKVRKNTAAIRLSCPPASRGNCTGSLALRTAKPVNLAGRTRILQLGHARYNLAPGVSRRLKVQLAKITRRVADRKGHLKVLAVASTGTSGRTAHTSQRLTLALGKGTKSK